MKPAMDSAAALPARFRPTAATPDASGGLPLTMALLKVAATAVSFATPGHRAGRSCRVVPHADVTANRPRPQ